MLGTGHKSFDKYQPKDQDIVSGSRLSEIDLKRIREGYNIFSRIYLMINKKFSFIIPQAFLTNDRYPLCKI